MRRDSGEGRYDLAIIGGGVNGCGIARDAAGRGASVVLCEQGDLAGATSSASTKLVHGGLRYLEHYKFGLVSEALAEREVLWRIAPHLVRPLRFVLPHHRGLRPKWMLRAGLFLYDHLARRAILPAAATLNLRRDPVGGPLQPKFVSGFAYSDCAVDDARLTMLNARAAADRGADIRVRTRVETATRHGDHWQLTTRDASGRLGRIEARVLVNAAGPWANQVLAQATGRDNTPIRLVQGSHIVVPRLYEHDQAYIFQNADGRIFFAIPFEDDFTLIGTTERDYDGDPSLVNMTEDERDYLCAAASAYFREPVRPADIVWSYSGVRPLYDDGASSARQTTREYVLDLDTGGAPILSVFGGKITTYRRLAEAVLSRLAPHLPALPVKAWTGNVPLPGGDFAIGGFGGPCRELGAAHPLLPEALLRRLVRAYGTRAASLLSGVHGEADLGRHFGAGLYEREVRYLVAWEWARSAEDILWRRSKLGLRLGAADTAALQEFVESLAAGKLPTQEIDTQEHALS